MNKDDAFKAASEALSKGVGPAPTSLYASDSNGEIRSFSRATSTALGGEMKKYIGNLPPNTDPNYDAQKETDAQQNPEAFYSERYGGE